MARRGMEVRSEWLDRGLYLPSPEETVILGLSAGERVARISRLRLTGDTPLAIERASLAASVLPEPAAMGDSLYRYLESDGNRPVRAIQRIRAANLGDDDAYLLQVPVGSAGLNIERTSYLPSGRVIEFTARSTGATPTISSPNSVSATRQAKEPVPRDCSDPYAP